MGYEEVWAQVAGCDGEGAGIRWRDRELRYEDEAQQLDDNVALWQDDVNDKASSASVTIKCPFHD